MIELTKKLSEGFPHVRVDFYEANGQVYFGEMTFYHFGAIVPFETKEWDKKIGDWLVLPEKLANMKIIQRKDFVGCRVNQHLTMDWMNDYYKRRKRLKLKILQIFVMESVFSCLSLGSHIFFRHLQFLQRCVKD